MSRMSGRQGTGPAEGVCCARARPACGRPRPTPHPAPRHAHRTSRHTSQSSLNSKAAQRGCTLRSTFPALMRRARGLGVRGRGGRGPRRAVGKVPRHAAASCSAPGHPRAKKSSQGQASPFQTRLARGFQCQPSAWRLWWLSQGSDHREPLWMVLMCLSSHCGRGWQGRRRQAEQSEPAGGDADVDCKQAVGMLPEWRGLPAKARRRSRGWLTQSAFSSSTSSQSREKARQKASRLYLRSALTAGWCGES